MKDLDEQIVVFSHIERLVRWILIKLALNFAVFNTHTSMN